MIHTLSTVTAVIVALTLFQSATLVIGGHVLKDALSPFYEAFPEWWQRMLIVIVPLSGVGNLFAVYAFQNPIVAGITFMIVGLWSPLIVANIIGRTSYGPMELAIVVAISILGLTLSLRLS